MISTLKKLTTAQNITGATVVFNTDHKMDMTNQGSVSCQVNTSGAGLTGTAKLQQSNDGVTWFDFPAAQYPNASKAIASNGAVMLEADKVTAAFVTLSVAVSVGTAATTFSMLGKEY